MTASAPFVPTPLGFTQKLIARIHSGETVSVDEEFFTVNLRHMLRIDPNLGMNIRRDGQGNVLISEPVWPELPMNKKYGVNL